VVGAEIAAELNTPAPLLVGKDIRIGSQSFEVVGVLAGKGEMGFIDPDETVYVPASTAQYRLFGGRDRLNAIAAKINAGPEAMDAAFDLIDPSAPRTSC